MIKMTLLILSASLVVWLTELLALVSIRMYQVRDEYFHWFNATPERQRVLALVLGFWMLLGYVILQDLDDIWAREPAGYIAGGVIGILMILWWIMKSIFPEKGVLIWTLSLFGGLLLGSLMLFWP